MEAEEFLNYESRQLYRNALSDYLASSSYQPNFLKIVYDLSPHFGVDPEYLDSREHRSFRIVAELALNDLIEIERTVSVLPPLKQAGGTATNLNRFAPASFS